MIVEDMLQYVFTHTEPIEKMIYYMFMGDHCNWNLNVLQNLKNLTTLELDNSNGVIFVFYDPDLNIVFLCGKASRNLSDAFCMASRLSADSMNVSPTFLRLLTDARVNSLTP